jgi:hypothetical protein
MQPLLAIAWLTLKAAIRYRLLLVLGLLLLAAVIGLPLVIKDDGTARGFVQIMLTYTLSLTTGLLGFATLWLSCGTLAREVEECQMQMVAVKPVARWQIWLGKWLGIMALNALLLAFAAGSVYGLMMWRASRLPTAPVDQRAILFNEVLVARDAVRPPVPDVDAEVEWRLRERLQNVPPEGLDRASLRQQVREEILAGHQMILPGFVRRWTIELGRAQDKARGQPLHLRVRFYAADPGERGNFDLTWEVGAPGRPRTRLPVERLAAESFHELIVPPDQFDERGVLLVECRNRSPVTLLFLVEDGPEVLYREGGFALNYLRGLLIHWFWLGLLAAIGLAMASALSFPVAAFVSLSLLVVAFSSGTLQDVVEQGSILEPDHETGEVKITWVDRVMVPAFKAVLRVVQLVGEFSPIDALSSGRSITWGQLAGAFARVIVLMGGIFVALGVALFNRRELATAPTGG